MAGFHLASHDPPTPFSLSAGFEVFFSVFKNTPPPKVFARFSLGGVWVSFPYKVVTKKKNTHWQFVPPSPSSFEATFIHKVPFVHLNHLRPM